MDNSTFNHLKSATNFTQLVVFKADEGVSGAVSGAVSQGYSIHINGSHFHTRIHPSTAYGSVTNEAGLLSDTEATLGVASYNQTGSSNPEKLYFRMNGELVIPNNFYQMSGVPNNNAGYRVGVGTDLNLKFEGDVAEVIVFDRNLTESEFIEIETYLLEKYGIAGGKQCKLPDSYTGYDVSNCDVSASDEQKLSAANC